MPIISYTKNQAKATNAFTIVELIVVIVVIAILATIVTVAYNGISKQAGDGALRSSLSTAAKKIEATKFTDGSYPTDIEGKDYVANTSIVYAFSGDGTTFCLTGRSPQSTSAFWVSNTQLTPTTGTCTGHEYLAGSDGYCLSSPDQWSPRTTYSEGSCVSVAGDIYRATTTHAAHGPRVVQVKSGTWNGAFGATLMLNWPSEAQAGDIVLFGVWQGSSASGSHTATVTVNGTPYTAYDSWARTAAPSYRGALYFIPYQSGTQISFATSTYVMAHMIVLRGFSLADLTTLRETNSNSLVVGEWDPAARALTHNGMILTVGIPRNAAQQWTWTADNDAVSYDSFVTGWADYTNLNTELIITTGLSNAATVWTLGVSQPAFNSSGWDLIE